eukprot:3135091-Lingulodinium_polyedra.AAC.1
MGSGDSGSDQPAAQVRRPALGQPIPEHEAVDFDGAARVATNVMAERLLCALCKGVFLTHWYCELDVDTMEFHRPIVEEAEH